MGPIPHTLGAFIWLPAGSQPRDMQTMLSEYIYLIATAENHFRIAGHSGVKRDISHLSELSCDFLVQVRLTPVT
jgi:hypothetical protein